ncbi:unnamed protein product [Adineta steineri]|uniref:ethanolamine kinase n=2 Tax=Adineta steineri TaxID=433720 RepID=A0A819TZH3_9BILA|nr:unnamed protein product [Adineta steineri]CAF4083274.1 unnamed protein product [Adineta steineri]
MSALTTIPKSTSTTIPNETVEIDVNAVETNASRLVCSIKPRWALKKFIFKKFTDDNHFICYAISLKNNEDDQSSVIIKVNPTNADVYTDYQEQFRLLNHFIQNKTAAPILLKFTNGYISSYIEGKTLDIKEKETHELIARKIAELHLIPNKFQEPHFIDKLKHLIDLFTDKSKNLRTRLVKIQKEKEKSGYYNKNFLNSFKSVIGFNTTPTFPLTMAQLQLQLKDISWTELSNDIDCIRTIFEKNWSSFDIPVVLGLNNMRVNNFLFDSKTKEVSIIDFDHCSQNYCLIDIVQYFLELASEDFERKYPSRQIQKQFLREYLKNTTLNLSSIIYDHLKPSDLELDQLCDLCGLLIAPVHLYWALWAFLQALLTKPRSTFDYVKYGRIRLAQYYLHKNKFFLPLNHAQKDKPKF